MLRENKQSLLLLALQHAVTFAAGLACEGMIPFCAIYSSFLQRGYDQIIHDVALQSLPVRFAMDRAGLVGADGATHCGFADVAYMGCIPNMVVMAVSLEHYIPGQITKPLKLFSLLYCINTSSQTGGYGCCHFVLAAKEAIKVQHNAVFLCNGKSMPVLILSLEIYLLSPKQQMQGSNQAQTHPALQIKQEDNL